QPHGCTPPLPGLRCGDGLAQESKDGASVLGVQFLSALQGDAGDLRSESDLLKLKFSLLPLYLRNNSMLINCEQQYASSILHHFVGSRDPNHHEANFEVLCKVLQSMRVGDHDVPCQIVSDYERRMENGDLLVQSVVCFCDIPLPQLP